MYNQNLGRLGEKRAEEYYAQLGYKILQKNYHTPFTEFDLVCQKDNLTVFVEVKTRTNLSFGRPEEAVTKSKLNKIRKGISCYLLNAKNNCSDCRFDVVSIILSDDGKADSFEVFENVGV